MTSQPNRKLASFAVMFLVNGKGETCSKRVYDMRAPAIQQQPARKLGEQCPRRQCRQRASLWHRAIRDDPDARLAEAVISVDTFQSVVARAAVEAGADMVNDVSGGLLDPAMHSTVGRPPPLPSHHLLIGIACLSAQYVVLVDG